MYRLATRYAEALIDAANELHVLKPVSDDLILIRRIIKESHDFQLFLKSPVIKKEKKQAVISATFRSVVQPLTFQFLSLLIEKDREQALAGMIAAFFEQQDVNQGIVHVQVKTAAALSQQQAAQLKQRFETYSKKKIVIDQSVDTHLIGGLIARIGDTVFDGSVKQQLENLRKRFAEEITAV